MQCGSKVFVLVKATFEEVDDGESDEQNGGDSHTTEMVEVEQTTVHATTPSSENRSTTFEGDFETVDSHKVSVCDYFQNEWNILDWTHHP